MSPSSDGSPKQGDAGEGRDARSNRAAGDDRLARPAARPRAVDVPDASAAVAAATSGADSDAVMDAMMSGNWSRSDLLRVDGPSTEFEPPQRAVAPDDVEPTPKIAGDVSMVPPLPRRNARRPWAATALLLPFAAAGAAVTIWYALRTPLAPDAAPAPSPAVDAAKVAARRTAKPRAPLPSPPRSDERTAPATTTAPPEPVGPDPQSAAPPLRGLRVAPPGTPPAVAATFARLPVSVADLPPIGGVGESGVHVDRLEMGSAYDKGMCAGPSDGFSLAKTDIVNVCIRVVHPRVDEVLSIVWQKNESSTARRGKIAVKPLHAYRTRAYLMLRREYIGDWTVRILSPEGVELAAHGFSIVP